MTLRRGAMVAVVLAGGAIAFSTEAAHGCPRGMALIDPSDPRSATAGRIAPKSAYCMDRYEASLVEVTKAGPIHHSPYEPVGARHVRAISEKGRTPQAYISRNEAQQACRRAGKRLCTTEEWVFACKGRNPTTFPYGATRKIGYCNDAAPVSPLDVVFGNDPARHQRDRLNDPRLNRVPRTLAKSGAYERCKNGFGVFDLVGNLHEWVDDPSGKFRGGYYLDSHENGDGCDYVTVAHGPDYHDYSTGFRCCAAPGGRSGRKGG